MEGLSLIEFVASRFVAHSWGLTWMILIILLLAVIERMFPAERGQTVHGRLRNIGFTVIFQLGGGILLSLVAYLFLPHLLLEVQARDRSLMEHIGLVMLYMFVTDVVFYWYHRAQHSVTSLWMIHELHHSDSELNATSSLRTYLLERPAQFLAISLPLAVIVSKIPGLEHLSLSPEEARTLYLVSIAWLFFAHANLRLECGRWSWLVTAPQVHRIHHSIEPQHQQRNFAQFFPVIDVVFGTYHQPQPGEFPRTGTTGMSSDVSLLRALRKPFDHRTPIVLLTGLLTGGIVI